MSRVLPAWKTIIIDTRFRYQFDFFKWCIEHNVFIGDYARIMCNHDQQLLDPKKLFRSDHRVLCTHSVSTTSLLYDIVRLRITDLGYPQDAHISMSSIYVAALQCGYMLCPKGLALFFRGQYTEQQRDEWLIVATEPILSIDGKLLLFSVDCNDQQQLYLHGTHIADGALWSSMHEFVFVKTIRAK